MPKPTPSAAPTQEVRGLSGWIVATTDEQSSSYAFDRREDAIDHANKIARTEHSAVEIIAPDGEVVAAGIEAEDDPVMVVPRDDGWAVLCEDAELEHHPTKREALDAARDRARREGRDLISYYEDGTFQRRYSYSE